MTVVLPAPFDPAFSFGLICVAAGLFALAYPESARKLPAAGGWLMTLRLPIFF